MLLVLLKILLSWLSVSVSVLIALAASHQPHVYATPCPLTDSATG